MEQKEGDKIIKNNCTNITGNYKCSYCIQTPFITPSFRDEEVKRFIQIDKCLLPEIIHLWERGIITTGCCCGHGIKNYAYIGVTFECIPRMKELGYKVQYNPCRPKDEDSFYPKTVFDYNNYKGE